MPRLQSLNLNRTNVTADMLSRLDGRGTLRKLSLIHSDVTASQLTSLANGENGRPPWATTRHLEELRLGHPSGGDSDELVLSNWPSLQTVVINEFESQPNSTPMRVELVDLPALKTLRLDAFQKYDLILRKVPKLTEVKEEAFEWANRLSRGASVPGALWCKRLTIDGADSLEKLTFDARSIEHVRYKHTPKLTFVGVGAWDRSTKGETAMKELKPEVASAIIEGIGASDGPATVDLEHVPLANIDLSPLIANRGITNLKLARSSVTPKHWMALGPMKQLTDFQIDSNELDDKSLSWLLDEFPALENLQISTNENTDGYNRFRYIESGALHSLELVNRPNLKTIMMDPLLLLSLSSIKIVDVPRLESELRFGYSSKIEVSGVPSIQGFSVDGPLPPDARLDGFRDLKFFAVGGSEVTDATIASLSSCEQITTLTLAYPSIGVEGLQSIKINPKMKSISLPGTPLDDAIALAWPPLTSVLNLNVADTKITAKGIGHLCGGSSIRRLVIDRTGASSAELNFIANLPDLEHLSLVGVGVSPAALDRILKIPTLKSIDLSNSIVTAAHADAVLNSGANLGWVGLRNTEIPEAKFRELLTKRSTLAFDIEPSAFSTEFAALLISSNQIQDQQQWHWIQTSAQSSGLSGMTGGFSISQGPGRDYELINIDPATIVPPSGGTLPVSAAPPVAVQMGQWLGGLLNQVVDRRSENE